MKSKEECRIFFEKISEFIDGELDEEKKGQMEEHLRDCKPCLKYIDSLKKLKECLKKENEIDCEEAELVKKCLEKFFSKINNG
ncbi:MAG: anti-sigma factor [Acidobacteriota bacterium]